MIKTFFFFNSNYLDAFFFSQDVASIEDNIKENHKKCEIRIHIIEDREDNTKFTHAFIIKLLV